MSGGQAEGSAADRGKAKGLFGYIRPYLPQLSVGIVFLLATNAAEKAIPWLFKNALDALAVGDLEPIGGLALGVVGLAAVMWAVRTLSRVWIFNVGRDVEFDLRNDLIEKIHALGPPLLARMGTGDVMSRATNDLGQVRLLVGFAGLNIVNSIIAFASAIALMVAISPELTLYALAPYPLLVFATRIFGVAIYRRSRASQEALATLTDRAQENVAGTRLIRAMGLEDHERARFAVANDEAVKRTMALVVLRGLLFPVLAGVAALGTLLVVWVGGGMVLDRTLSPGGLAAFLAYVGLLVWPTLALGYVLAVLQRGRASFARVKEILDSEPVVAEHPAAQVAAGPGAIRVEGLTFARGDTDVLRDVSFEVPAGGSLAVVGPSGSGKSTLAALMPRLLPTPPETIFLDGERVEGLTLESLRHRVGYAQQEPFLFSTTIERNLRFALEDPDATDADARIRHAITEACVVDDVEAMGEGLDTVVGERGVQLSGGQKQRLALARALLREPRVLVLDDPMSAVDAETEASILEALSRAKEGRTMILVTHRVAAARRADRIVVLDEGRVVEAGTHDELLAEGGLYARLAARQRLEAEIAEL